MNIGFIGLGIMGKPMCVNLLKNDSNVSISSSNGVTNDELAKKGAGVVKDFEAVAQHSDVIVLMLPDSAEVYDVVVKSELYKKFRPETVVVDMSSINPEMSKKVSVTIGGEGHQYIDAPVSGGEEKAVDGTLSIMAGGDATALEKVRPLLELMGGSIVHTGPVGSGNSVKLVNQVIVANNIIGLSEGLALAKELDLDLDTVYDAISGGLAGSTVMENKFSKMADQNYAPGFKMKLHLKDLNNAFESLDEEYINEKMPVTIKTKEIMAELIESAGVSEEDHSALFKYYIDKK